MSEEPSVPLQRYIDQRFEAFGRLIELSEAKSADAVALARETIDHRLKGLNESRGHYDERLRILENTLANLAGRLWALGILPAVISLLLAILSMGLTLWREK